MGCIDSTANIFIKSSDMYNFFTLFDMQVCCEIEDSVLRQKYFFLQKKYHPDYSKNKDIDIALINKGYEVLSNKLSRLKHILEINEIKFTETINDMKFLMKCMEWQENKAKYKKEILKQLDIETEETVKQIDSKNFKSASDHLQNALYLNRILN